MAESRISVEALLEAGAHFGHLTRRWNPKMRKFIFTERNGIHILDLRKTQILIDYARDIIHEIAAQGRVILFVGTKSQARTTMQKHADAAGVNYVVERWLGGMLTNFATIRRSIKRLNTIDKMEEDGTFESITKKERLLLTREKDRLRKVFGGIETMTRLPGAIFVVDAKKEHLAVKEARVLGIPVIGIIDTNTDPDMVDYPIPANDDSVQTIDLIAGCMADAIIEGAATAKIRQAELGYDPNVKEENLAAEAAEKAPRKLRERRSGERGGDNRGGGDRGGRGNDRGNSRGDRQPRSSSDRPDNRSDRSNSDRNSAPREPRQNREARPAAPVTDAPVATPAPAAE
jgi:small subunit ribosomal protein S2